MNDKQHEHDHEHDDFVITVESGVSLFTKEPFCQIRLNGQLLGQLKPSEVRQMAMNWLATAEAAESDAAVFSLLTKRIELDENTAGHFIAELREHRG